MWTLQTADGDRVKVFNSMLPGDSAAWIPDYMPRAPRLRPARPE